MKISGWIKLLEEAKEKHGDLEVKASNSSEGVYFEITKVTHDDDFMPDTVFIED